jgi:hypothetical protein
MVKHKIQIPVIVLRLARKKYSCDGHSKDSREAKLRAREIQLNKDRARNIGRVHCYFD